MNAQKGHSLVETLWALFLGTIVLGALLGAVRHAQIFSSDLDLLLERDGNLWLLPVLLSQWMTPAGNMRSEGQWEGLSISENTVSARSDIDGASGFPDGDTSDRYENIALKCSGGSLRMRSGGGGFQPVSPAVVSLRPSWSGRILRLEITTATARPLWRRSAPSLQTVEVLYALPNYRPTLFEGGSEQ